MKSNPERGFTIIELLVASALFITVVAVAAGSFISVLDSSSRARALQELSTNIDFALEDISRNIRVGYDLQKCEGSSSCLSLIAYEAGSEYAIEYQLDDGVIEKSQTDLSSGSNSFDDVPLTSPDVFVTELVFTIDDSGDTEQPRVTINMVANSASGIEETFVIQTSVTQRILDRRI